MATLTCLECFWQGDESELVSKTDELDDIDFSYCPMCGSDNFEVDEDESDGEADGQ